MYDRPLTIEQNLWLANHEQSHIKQIERIVNTLRTERRGTTSKEEGAHGDASR